MTSERFHLVVEAPKGARPGVTRLRGFLKRLLHTHGMRVVEARRVDACDKGALVVRVDLGEAGEGSGMGSGRNAREAASAAPRGPPGER